MISAGESRDRSAGFQMIRSIDIQNFRCFEHLQIDGVKRFNVIVGDNSAGKTALLEALFLTLAGNVEVSLRLRQQRGLEGTFSGSTRAIEEAIWRDLFFEYNWNRGIRISLNATGVDNRSLTIARGGDAGLFIPFEGVDQIEGGIMAPLQFVWTDSLGVQHPYTPRITSKGMETSPSNEDLPDFFLFAANHTPPAGETAARFSQLSLERRHELFVSIFTREYPWIEDLSIEVAGGAPVIHASLRGSPRKLPLNIVSGGINRVVAIMLALASNRGSIVLVDEIENGIYYKHKAPLWRGILELARSNECQMFLTTHDEEWLSALVEAAGDKDEDDIAVWRLERGDGGKRILRQYSGRVLASSIEFGGEIR